MNLRGKILVTATLVAILVWPAFGGDSDKKEELRRSKAIASLMVGLSSDNAGLQESSAHMLGELKSTEAVVPLMKLLHESESESMRLIAALALTRIGDGRGTYAVRQAARFDASQRVRTTAAWFYNEYYRPGSFAFVPADSLERRLVAEK